MKITPKTTAQSILLSALQEGAELIFAIGPAGVGKSYVVAAHAAKSNKRIVITRPNMPCGKELGFRPGSMQEKMAEWLAPIVDVLNEFLGKEEVAARMADGRILVQPIETVRGRSFKDCIVIVDEAQNLTMHEIDAFVTRTGENSQIILSGDPMQADVRNSGLVEAVEMCLTDQNLLNHVRVVEFYESDIVRSGLCKAWVIARRNKYAKKTV